MLSITGHKVGVLDEQEVYGADINGVRYMTVYGIKGLAAYACHAAGLGEVDPWVSKFIYKVQILFSAIVLVFVKPRGGLSKVKIHSR